MTLPLTSKDKELTKAVVEQHGVAGARLELAFVGPLLSSLFPGVGWNLIFKESRVTLLVRTGPNIFSSSVNDINVKMIG